MKAINIIVLVAILAISLPTEAKDTKRSNRKVQQKVSAVISAADTDVEGAVNAKFQLEEDGSVRIISVESEKVNLRQMVESKLKDMTIKGETIDVKKLFNMNFIFHREKG
ncbi:MAG: hypothetical protein ACI9AT_001028 [Ulvibacter sp.]|jgi:hypothetical protein